MAHEERAKRAGYPEVTYDLGDFGLGILQGIDAIRNAAIAMGDRNPVGHHVTNTILTEVDGQVVRVRSKGIGIQADGSSGSVVYDDIVKQTAAGWRITHRQVSARRAPLSAQLRPLPMLAERLAGQENLPPDWSIAPIRPALTA